ncbi:hypothetical protein ACRAWF_32765 [Streptomyces sp. L7]
MTRQVVRAGVVIDLAGGPTVQDQGTQVVGNWRDILKSEVVPRVVAEDTDDGPKAVRDVLAAGAKALVYLGPLDATVRTARDPDRGRLHRATLDAGPVVRLGLPAPRGRRRARAGSW